MCDCSNHVGSSTATFLANTNTRACIQLTVADDDIYGTSSIPMYTVGFRILNPTNSRVTVGGISQTTVTVRDDDGMNECDVCVWFIIVYNNGEVMQLLI